MNDPTHPTLAEILADLDASEAETGPGVPFEEVEVMIEAAIERAERGTRADRHRKAVQGQ